MSTVSVPGTECRRLPLFLMLAFGLLVCGAGAACHSSHPLRNEFRGAVLAQEPSEHGPGDSEAVLRFVREHGVAAVPLYEDVIEKNRHSWKGVEERELVASIEGLGEIKRASASSLFWDLAVDKEVSPWATRVALSQLANVSQQQAIEAAGVRMQLDDRSQVRREIVGFLWDVGSAEGVGVLRAAMQQNLSPELREFMVAAIRVLQRPEVCQLIHKQHWKSQDASGWSCSYQCAGPGRGYGLRRSEAEGCEPEMPQRAPSR